MCTEKAMASHSSTLAWRSPRTEEPGGLQSVGSRRVGHDWATSLSVFTSCIGEGNGNPLQCSCLENPRDGGSWWAAVYGVTQSRTRLKRLSSSSSSSSRSKLCVMTGNVRERKFAPTNTVKKLEEEADIIAKTSVINRMTSSCGNHLRAKEIFILFLCLWKAFSYFKVS